MEASERLDRRLIELIQAVDELRRAVERHFRPEGGV